MVATGSGPRCGGLGMTLGSQREPASPAATVSACPAVAPLPAIPWTCGPNVPDAALSMSRASSTLWPLPWLSPAPAQVIESIFYMWRATHDPKWRDMGWQMWRAIERYARWEGGYSGAHNADQVGACWGILAQGRWAGTLPYSSGGVAFPSWCPPPLQHTRVPCLPANVNSALLLRASGRHHPILSGKARL